MNNITSDEEYTSINKRMLTLDKKLKKQLTSEQYQLFLEYEKECINLECRIIELLHSQNV